MAADFFFWSVCPQGTHQYFPKLSFIRLDEVTSVPHLQRYFAPDIVDAMRSSLLKISASSTPLKYQFEFKIAKQLAESELVHLVKSAAGRSLR